MTKDGRKGESLWNEEDGFFYDMLGHAQWTDRPSESALARGAAPFAGCRDARSERDGQAEGVFPPGRVVHQEKGRRCM